MFKRIFFIFIVFVFFIKCGDSSSGSINPYEKNRKIEAKKIEHLDSLNIQKKRINELDLKSKFLSSYDLSKQKSFIETSISEINTKIQEFNDLNKVSEIQNLINALKLNIGNYDQLIRKIQEIKTQKTRLTNLLNTQKNKKNELDTQNANIISDKSLQAKKQEIEKKINKMKTQVQNLKDLSSVLIIKNLIQKLEIDINQYEQLIELEKTKELTLVDLKNKKESLDKRYENIKDKFDCNRLLILKSSIESMFKDPELNISELENKISEYENLLKVKEPEIQEVETQKTRLTDLLNTQEKRKNKLDKDYEIYISNFIDHLKVEEELSNLKAANGNLIKTKINQLVIFSKEKISDLELSIEKFKTKINNYEDLLSKKRSEIIKNFEEKIKKNQNKKDQVDVTLAQLKDKETIENNEKKEAELALKAATNLLNQKSNSFENLGVNKEKIDCLIKKSAQKVADYFKKVENQKTQEEIFPKQNYAQAAEAFYEFMKEKYQFFGDGDNWNDFEDFYTRKKIEFRRIPITNGNIDQKAINLFQKWIDDLVDMHFYMDLSHEASNSRERLRNRNKRRNNIYISYPNLSSLFDFTEISSSNDNFLFGHINVKKEKVYYFYIEGIPKDFSLSPTYKNFVSTLEKNDPSIKGIILDFCNNQGGDTIHGFYFSSEFLEEGVQFGWRKDRIEGGGPLDKSKGYFPWFHFSNRQNKRPSSGLTTLPVVILVSRNTASMGEHIAAVIRQRGKTLIIGENTTGALSSSLGPKEVYKKNGISLNVNLGEGGVIRFAEEELESKGLIPDHLINPLDSKKIIQKALDLIFSQEVSLAQPKFIKKP